MDPKMLLQLSEDDDLLEVGRLAIEDALLDLRDSRLSTLHRNNGLVVNEKDGRRSDIIRMGPEAAIKIALKAIAKHIRSADKEAPKNTTARNE